LSEAAGPLSFFKDSLPEGPELVFGWPADLQVNLALAPEVFDVGQRKLPARVIVHWIGLPQVSKSVAEKIAGSERAVVDWAGLDPKSKGSVALQALFTRGFGGMSWTTLKVEEPVKVAKGDAAAQQGVTREQMGPLITEVVESVKACPRRSAVFNKWFAEEMVDPESPLRRLSLVGRGACVRLVPSR
jgi:hypothetical protein